MIQKYKGFVPQVHETCYLAPGCAVVGDVTLAAHASVWHNAVLRGDIGHISVGENSNIQDGCVLHCVTDVPVTVGKNVTVGHGAILHSCTIEDGCLIGMGSIVLDRVVVGRNCLIGAGSVVVPGMNIPEGSLVMGSPARIKRALTEEEISRLGEGVEHYLRLSEEYDSDESDAKGE